MLRFKVFTLVPDLISAYIESAMPLKRGIQKNLLEIQAVNFRDFSEDRHKKVDDTAYGGGPGMVIKPEPLIKAVETYQTPKTRIIFMDPKGQKLDHDLAKNLSREEEIFLICGKYEGIDQRVYDILGGEMISLGDFVMTGGELSALAVIDSTSRFIEGTMDSFESKDEESFSEGLLEYPHYTRPLVFREKKVPDVLLSGHHENIRQWKLKNSLKNTIKNRPELLKLLNLKDLETGFVKEIIKELYNGNKCRTINS